MGDMRMNADDHKTPSSDDSPFEMTPVAPESPATGGRPQNLTVICILAMILGGFGLLTGCFGVMSLVFASQARQAISAMPPGVNNPTVEMQKQMNDKMAAINNRYKWVTLPLMLVKLCVEAAILIGAIMTLGLKPRGRSWLLAGLIAALVLESIQVVPGIMVQSETFAMMREMVPVQQGANAPPGMNDFMTVFFSAIGIGTIVMTLGWLAAKFIFYVIGIRYLRKPAVAALFALPRGE
jgi:hypothetical protein